MTLARHVRAYIRGCGARALPLPSSENRAGTGEFLHGESEVLLMLFNRLQEVVTLFGETGAGHVSPLLRSNGCRSGVPAACRGASQKQ